MEDMSLPAKQAWARISAVINIMNCIGVVKLATGLELFLGYRNRMLQALSFADEIERLAYSSRGGGGCVDRHVGLQRKRGVGGGSLHDAHAGAELSAAQSAARSRSRVHEADRD